MEELKELIQLINGLPTLAIWVLAGFWAYKVIVIGSIYGLIKFLATKALEAYKKDRVVTTKIDAKLAGITIGGEDGTVMLALMAQLQRIAGHGYIHNSDVTRLCKALDWLEAQEKSK